MAINFPATPTLNQTYTYNGRTWTYNNVGWQATGSTGLTVYTKTNFTATAAQTTFSVTYTVGFVDVYYNGSKLSSSEYTATTGSTVVLGTACALNDIVETIAWTISSSFNPSLGSASATSLAIGGATIGSNALAVTGTTQLNSALNYGGVTLSNAVTGTGNMVLSAGPTLTGTVNTQNVQPTADATHNIGGASNRYAGAFAGHLSDGSQAAGEMVGSGGTTMRLANGSGWTGISTTKSLGIGMTPTNVLDITQNQNAGSQTSLLNNSAGVNANAAYKLNNGTNAVYFALSGTGNSGTFPNVANMSSIQTTGGALALTTGSATPIQFGINYAEKARFDTSGNLLINSTATGGPTTVSKLVVTNSNTNVAYLDDTDAGTSDSLIIRKASTAGTLARFYYTSTSVGTITTNGTTTTYGTSSDYRLKENVLPMTGGLATVAALKPVTYDWIADQTAGEGFIAHELQAVIPAAVTGEKDALDKDGNMDPQGVDFGKIVPHLVAAIQELTTRLAALEAK